MFQKFRRASGLIWFRRFHSTWISSSHITTCNTYNFAVGSHITNEASRLIIDILICVDVLQ